MVNTFKFCANIEHSETIDRSVQIVFGYKGLQCMLSQLHRIQNVRFHHTTLLPVSEKEGLMIWWEELQLVYGFYKLHYWLCKYQLQ